MTDILLTQILHASKLIGGIYQSASWYTSMLCDRVRRTGKPIADITIGELINLDLELQRELAKQTIVEWDEQRMNIIGQNGNDGLHYEVAGK